MNIDEEDMTNTNIYASNNIALEYMQRGSPVELSTLMEEFNTCPVQYSASSVSQSCLTPGTLWTVALQTSVHGIFQAETLEWVSISSSSPIQRLLQHMGIGTEMWLVGLKSWTFNSA